MNLMKTPWRFLRDLTSRKKLPPPEAQFSLPAPASDSGDPKAEVVPPFVVSDGGQQPSPDVHTAVQTELPQADEHSGQLDDAQQLDHLASAPVDLSDAVASPPMDAETEDADPKPSPDRAGESAPSRARRKRAERIPSTNVVESAIAHTEGQSLEIRPQAVPEFFDEVVGLDDEIRQLRAALTEKLTLQNAQLRKMLERFDV
jgi:hypothetical protein